MFEQRVTEVFFVLVFCFNSDFVLAARSFFPSQTRLK